MVPEPSREVVSAPFKCKAPRPWCTPGSVPEPSRAGVFGSQLGAVNCEPALPGLLGATCSFHFVRLPRPVLHDIWTVADQQDEGRLRKGECAPQSSAHAARWLLASQLDQGVSLPRLAWPLSHRGSFLAYTAVAGVGSSRRCAWWHTRSTVRGAGAMRPACVKRSLRHVRGRRWRGNDLVNLTSVRVDFAGFPSLVCFAGLRKPVCALGGAA